MHFAFSTMVSITQMHTGFNWRVQLRSMQCKQRLFCSTLVSPLWINFSWLEKNAANFALQVRYTHLDSTRLKKSDRTVLQNWRTSNSSFDCANFFGGQFRFQTSIWKRWMTLTQLSTLVLQNWMVSIIWGPVFHFVLNNTWQIHVNSTFCNTFRGRKYPKVHTWLNNVNNTKVSNW